ncbi:hypothetical protein UF75_0434 [Desulfosporosinus sp. I2]|nr:hypothetical protein UF75_0434 [Desulfosporosinus sp. I2]
MTDSQNTHDQRIIIKVMGILSVFTPQKGTGSFIGAAFLFFSYR